MTCPICTRSKYLPITDTCGVPGYMPGGTVCGIHMVGRPFKSGTPSPNGGKRCCDAALGKRTARFWLQKDVPVARKERRLLHH